MADVEFTREELLLEEIQNLSKYLEGIPEALRTNGTFEAYYARLKSLQEEVINRTLVSLKIDKTAISVVSLYDDNSEDKAYWFSRSPEERLRHVEILRRINYGNKATARLQRILEFAEREES